MTVEEVVDGNGNGTDGAPRGEKIDPCTSKAPAQPTSAFVENSNRNKDKHSGTPCNTPKNLIIFILNKFGQK